MNRLKNIVGPDGKNDLVQKTQILNFKYDNFKSKKKTTNLKIMQANLWISFVQFGFWKYDYISTKFPRFYSEMNKFQLLMVRSC